VARVVLTQPQPRAQAVAEALTARGHEVLALPFAAIEPLTGEPPVAVTLARLAQFDRVVFVSPTAIDVVLEALGDTWPVAVAPAIVGPGSAEALARHGLDGHPGLLMPAGPVFDADALLAHPGLAAPLRQRILVVRAQGGNRAIEEALALRGAAVQPIEAYCRRTVEPSANALATLACWLGERLETGDSGDGGRSGSGGEGSAGGEGSEGVPRGADASLHVVVTTVDAADGLARLASRGPALRTLSGAAMLAIHPRIACRLRELGFWRVRLIAPGFEALRSALESR